MVKQNIIKQICPEYRLAAPGIRADRIQFARIRGSDDVLGEAVATDFAERGLDGLSFFTNYLDI